MYDTSGRQSGGPQAAVRFAVALTILGLLALATAGCEKEGCLTGDDPECIVPSPCPDLAYTCSGGEAQVLEVTGMDELPGGFAALGSPGDILLRNDRVEVVIDALDHPHYLGPTGGGILDMTTVGADADSMRHIVQVTGVLPFEAAEYTDMRLLTGDGFAAVQFRGHLAGRPDVPIATRYEVRPCEPGLRIRTEVVNLEHDPMSLFLVDGFYDGGRGLLPFSVAPGAGFEHPEFGLSTLADGITETPYFVWASAESPATSYGAVACNAESMSGFHSESVVTSGLAAKVLMPSDYAIYERFIAAADGPAVSGAADLALGVREQLFDEPSVELSGVVLLDEGGDHLDSKTRAAVLISEGTLDTPREERIPRTQAMPDADGHVSARVPPDRSYVLELESHGVVLAEQQIDVGAGDADFGELDAAKSSWLTLDATLDGLQDHVQVFVHPADDATDEAVRGTMFDHFTECAPLLGNPFGASPACNRVLVDGPVTVELLPGTYDVFATAGPFATLAVERDVQTVAGDEVSVLLELESLPVLPDGVLSADLHVHGNESFDSEIPHDDRVRAFLASGIDVIAATGHFVAGNYDDAIADLAAEDRLAVMTGVETTGSILFKLVPDAEYPQVIGHWNLWPLPYDPEGPYRGAAWDQLMLPGEMFTAMRDAGWPEDTGVIQLNHPISYLEFGRDLGWVSALGIDGTEPLPAEFDGSLPSLFLHQPPGADFANSDFHTQEVMNGTNNDYLLAFRAFWFYELNQGLVRTGTANSDSHSLTDNVLGTPRNLVWTDTTLADFEADEFNAALRDGRVAGTNGPVLQVSVLDEGTEYVPSSTPLDQLGPSATLLIRIDAAPWVPVDEVRIVVDGEVVETLTEELLHPDDPLGVDGIERLDVELLLSDLVPDSGDHWLVVEAGHALEEAADLDCNGFPDTGDNNGDGTIDWLDVEEIEEDPEQDCFSPVGPFKEPPPPDGREGPDYIFRTVTPGGYPFAYANPLLFDPDRDGFEGVDR